MVLKNMPLICSLVFGSTWVEHHSLSSGSASVIQPKYVLFWNTKGNWQGFVLPFSFLIMHGFIVLSLWPKITCIMLINNSIGKFSLLVIVCCTLNESVERKLVFEKSGSATLYLQIWVFPKKQKTRVTHNSTTCQTIFECHSFWCIPNFLLRFSKFLKLKIYCKIFCCTYITYSTIASSLIRMREWFTEKSITILIV